MDSVYNNPTIYKGEDLKNWVNISADFVKNPNYTFHKFFVKYNKTLGFLYINIECEYNYFERHNDSEFLVLATNNSFNESFFGKFSGKCNLSPNSLKPHEFVGLVCWFSNNQLCARLPIYDDQADTQTKCNIIYFSDFLVLSM